MNPFHALVGALTPIRISSRTYLSQQLIRFGVDARAIPETCLQEFADDAVRTAKAAAKMTNREWRALVTDYIEGAAANISFVLNGDMDSMGRDLVDRDLRDRVTSVLKRHGVFLPARRQT